MRKPVVLRGLVLSRHNAAASSATAHSLCGRCRRGSFVIRLLQLSMWFAGRGDKGRNGYRM